MNKEEIRETIEETVKGILMDAWHDSKDNIDYNLERLPMDSSDYDFGVHEWMTNLWFDIYHRNRDYLEVDAESLIDYYEENFEIYENEF